MVKQDEDEIPLTTHDNPSSVTRETKARFESLLSAALKNENLKDKNRAPLPRPRTKKLKRKKLRNASNQAVASSTFTHSEEDDDWSQSTNKSTIEDDNILSTQVPEDSDQHRNQIIFSAEVHNNDDNESTNSSEQRNLIDNKETDLQTLISSTASEDNLFTSKNKMKTPVIVPRKRQKSGVNHNSSSNSNKNDGSSLDTLKCVSDENDYKNGNTVSDPDKNVTITNSDNSEERNSNVNEVFKTPKPLPRKNLSKPGSPNNKTTDILSSPNSGKSNDDFIKNITSEISDNSNSKILTSYDVINEIKGGKRLNSNISDFVKHVNVVSDSSKDKFKTFDSSNEIDNEDESDDKFPKKKRTKKRTKLRKQHTNDMEMNEMGQTTSTTTSSSVNTTLRRKSDTTQAEHSFMRKHSIPDDNIMFGVTIHGTDLLEPHPLLQHPMVRIYIIDIRSGKCLNKSDPTRPASFCDENVDYILPIMTHPYDFKLHRNLVPAWDEVLIFNESMSHIVSPNTVIFFEIVDFVNLSLGSMRYQRLGPNSGFHHIAWAFVKLVAANGSLNTEKKLRLQLYKPKFRSGGITRKAVTTTTPMVYYWWKEGLSGYIKYPSTLYITAGKVTPPSVPLTPSLRSRVVLQNEQGSAASIASTSAAQTDVDDDDGGEDGGEDDNDGTGLSKIKKSTPKKHRSQPTVAPNWSRLPAQSCKLTNNKYITIPVDLSGGFSIKFSNNGLSLACGTAANILIFDVPHFKKSIALSGHQGLIYNIRWSSDDAFLVSSSADCTACIWDVRKKIPAPQVLAHPSFVYCAEFVPHFVRQMVVTGCCDGTVRVWTRNKPSPYHLAQELAGHNGFINALCFNNDGLTFYTGDSIGEIKMWQFDQSCGEWACARDIKIREIRGVVINNLLMHVGGNRMLIHTRDSTLRMIDIPTYAVIQWFHGCSNVRIQMSSCLTPCGGILLSCSEDGLVCAWDCNTGVQLGLYNGLIKPSSSAAVAYHPLEHMMSVICYQPDTATQSQPLLYISNYDRCASGDEVGLKIFEPIKDKTPSSNDAKENTKNNLSTDRNPVDLWKKLESLSIEHSKGKFYNAAQHFLYSSTPKYQVSKKDNNYGNLRINSVATSDSRKFGFADSNNEDNNKKLKKKKILDKKDNSWSKLSKVSGFLIEKSITDVGNKIYNNKGGEINRGFQDDMYSSVFMTNNHELTDQRNESSVFFNNNYGDKLTGIIRRMDKVILDANNRSTESFA